jgi:hypothetical protein
VTNVLSIAVCIISSMHLIAVWLSCDAISVVHCAAAILVHEMCPIV